MKRSQMTCYILQIKPYAMKRSHKLQIKEVCKIFFSQSCSANDFEQNMPLKC